ncbi:MAG: matrixin family metalloprotease [Bacteroidota bacterium]
MNSLSSKLIYYTFVLALFSTSLQATTHPISIDYRIEMARQIAFGKVVQQHAFWDDAKENIYTVHLIEISAYLKEFSNKKYVEIITMGGVVEDEAQVVFPNITLQNEQEYFFFLSHETALVMGQQTNARTNQIPRYRPFASVQGILPYVHNHFIDYHTKQPVAAEQLVEKVEKQTRFVAQRPNGHPFYFSKKDFPAKARSNNNIQLRNAANENATHFRAGTADEAEELIIAGTGFGDEPGKVLFSNADFGGVGFIISNYESDLVYWTDREIRVKIPPKAGTGSIKLLNKAGREVGEAPISIDWAITPTYSSYKGFDTHTRQQVKFLNRNESGGYSIEVNTTNGLLDHTVALESFERALGKWQCATKINFTLDKTGTTKTFANDGHCVIQYSENLPLGVLGIATSRFKAVASSSCSGTKTLWYLKEFDIQFTPDYLMAAGYSWNFSSSQPLSQQFDFESIALHELGHAHGIGHVVNPTNVMYFGIANGESKKELDEAEIDAGRHRVMHSIGQNCISRFEPMIPLEQSCQVVETAKTATRIKVILEGCFDVSQQVMQTKLAAKGLLPLAQPFSESPYYYQGTENRSSSVNTEIVDWVLVQLRDKEDSNKVLAQKAALVKSDGLLIEAEGSNLITFDKMPNDEYYIALFHQSHLPILSRTPHLMNEDAMLYDFTINESAALGNAQLKKKSNRSMMNCGDFDGNGVINSQDFNLWKQNSSAIDVYLSADADGNGIINNQDFNLWKANRSKISAISVGNH